METDPLRRIADKQARRIVAAIAEDIDDRKGLSNAWNDIDESVMLEIEKAWREKIIAILMP